MKKLSELRKSKKFRMGFIGALMILILIMIFWGKKFTTVLWGLFIILAVALGMEGFDYDIDLGKFIETGNYQESRVETVQDKNGNSIRLIGECVKADVNCANFSTQGEAQNTYDTCMEEIAENNKNVDNPQNLDIYGLDRDKDGIACEALPA